MMHSQKKHQVICDTFYFVVCLLILAMLSLSVLFLS